MLEIASGWKNHPTLAMTNHKQKTLIPSQGRERNTPAVPPWFPPGEGRAPPLRGQPPNQQNTIHVPV